MALPSRVLNSGITSLSTVAICGEGAATVSAAGSTAATATALSSIYNQISTVTAGQGVKLPITEMSAQIYVTNSSATLLTVYPFDTGSTIAGAVSHAVNPGSSICYWAVSNTRWEPLQGFGGTQYRPAYGSFYSTATQTAALANTAYTATFNNTAENYLVSVGSPTSRIVCAVPGVYNFQFSAQLDKTNAATEHIFIWYRINGNDIANSASRFAINGSDSETVAAWNFVQTMAANDYFELTWAVTNTDVSLPYFAASAPIPAIPSVILTAQQLR